MTEILETLLQNNKNIYEKFYIYEKSEQLKNKLKDFAEKFFDVKETSSLENSTSEQESVN